LIAYLEITTWVGSSVVYGEHYYGKIFFGQDYVDVYTILTRTEAIKLNKAEEWSVFPYGIRYKQGEETSRFTDKKKLIKCATEVFNKKIKPKGFNILLECSKCIIDPCYMIIGPDNIKSKANKLWKQFEKFNGWECDKVNESKVQKICDEWSKLINGG